MAYIANRPVRFDRNYTVGEVIPAEVIEPKMARRLVDMGRILCVDIPEKDGGAGENPDAPQEGAGEPQGGTENAEGTNNQDNGETPQEGQNEAAGGEADAPQEGAGEFTCEVCGKQFGSKNALSAHLRTHKE